MSAARGGTIQPWSVRRLRITFGVVAVVAISLVVGLAFTAKEVLFPSDPPAVVEPADLPIGSDGIRGTAYRDALAKQPMMAWTEDDLAPQEPAMKQLEPITLARGSKVGALDIPSGFPHTPSGAVAQLSAITVATLTPLSVEWASEVYNGWAEDPARFESWPLGLAIASFHRSAGTVDGDPTVTLTARPTGAQIKGTDGSDWVLACVQVDVAIRITTQKRFGYGHCDRMQWNTDRWVIAPGTAPATAPSTWPGSQRSVEAGWHPLVQESEDE